MSANGLPVKHVVLSADMFPISITYYGMESCHIVRVDTMDGPGELCIPGRDHFSEPVAVITRTANGYVAVEKPEGFENAYVPFEDASTVQTPELPEGCEVINDEKGWRIRVKTVGPFHIEVLPMMFNWRVHTIFVDPPSPLDWSVRSWCYQGRTGTVLLRAIGAAMLWDGADDTEPTGWIKSWDGRRDGAPMKERQAHAE